MAKQSKSLSATGVSAVAIITASKAINYPPPADWGWGFVGQRETPPHPVDSSLKTAPRTAFPLFRPSPKGAAYYPGLPPQIPAIEQRHSRRSSIIPRQWHPLKAVGRKARRPVLRKFLLNNRDIDNRPRWSLFTQDRAPTQVELNRVPPLFVFP